MKYYLGIDIGKNYHVACITDDKGDLLRKPIKITANGRGMAKFLRVLDQTVGAETYADIHAGFEATGHYWVTLYGKLKELGMRISVLNPLEVKAFRNEGIGGSKTDRIDAVKIAKLLRFGDYREAHVPSEEMIELRQLTRLRGDLVNMATRMKQKAISIVDRIFPEYSDLFEDTFGTTSKAILSRATTPEEIAAIPMDELVEMVKKASRGRYGREYAVKVKSTATDTVGTRIGLDAFSLSIEILLSQINHLQGQIDQLDKIIGERVEKLGSTLMSIPGVGPTIAGVIHGEIGDVERFIGRDGAEKLVALAGIDPKVKDSGKSKGKVKMSKRGSPYLRHAIRQAAFIAATVSKEPMFEKIYRKQRNKGKALEVALSHVSREMLHVIYALLRDRREYQSTPPKRS